MLKKREKWTDYFFKEAELIATRSTCVRRQVGCVIVNETDKRILSKGFNGAPAGVKHCTEDTCLRKDIPSGEQLDRCKSAHSEANAIATAAKHGIKIDGAVLYCTHKPCATCIKYIINSGIKKVYYKNEYPSDMTDLLVKDISSDFELIYVK